MRRFVLVGLVCLLVGVGACGREVVEETTTVTTTEVATTEATTIEVTTTRATTTEPFEHTVKQRIHKSLPEFTFVLRGDVWQPNDWPDVEYAKIRSIEINGPNGKFHQLFDEFNLEIELIYKHQVNLSFADYNNDGYLDLRLLLVSDRNTSYSLFWLWDIEQQRFIENEQLKELSYSCRLFIDDDGSLRGSYNAGFGCGWGSTFYRFENDAFIAVEALDWFVEQDGVYLSTYQMVDGEMTLISTELWEGDQ